MLTPVREDITIQGNLGGQKVAMGIDQNSIAHLMSILTDLYSDPEAAVIRELSTNALDSHIEAGIKRPIEVTTPTQLHQYFTVKDFGVGMDTSDIENVFSLYGASTKRNTNDLTGTLGLGAKSPLTYSTAFTVTAVKNGIKTQVAVSREADGSGVMEIVDTSPTTESNGVEIIIPAKRPDRFLEKCNKFFRFWPEGTVLINGVKPERFKGTHVTDDIYLSEYDCHYIVMGNVAYPVDRYKFDPTGDISYNIVAFVGMGTVNFTPSREELQFTPTTDRTIKELKELTSTKLFEKMTKDIADATSYSDAVKRYQNWSTVWRSSHEIDEFTNKGEKLPNLFEHDDTIFTYSPNNYRYTSQTTKKISYNELTKNAMLVYNFKGKNLSSNHKAKLKQFRQEKNDVVVIHTNKPFYNVNKYIVCDNKVGGVWTKDLNWVNWDDVNAMVLPRYKAATINGVKIVTDPYDIIDKTTTYLTNVKTLDATKPIYYFANADRKSTRRNSYAGMYRYLTKIFPDATIVVIAHNRWKKFLRDYPTAITIEVAYNAWVKNIDKFFTDADLYQMDLGWRSEYFKKLDAKKIDDPALVDIINWANKGFQKNDILESAKWLSSKNGFEAFELKKIKDPFDNYHLVDMYRGGEDNYIYINAKYAAMQKDKNGVNNGQTKV